MLLVSGFADYVRHATNTNSPTNVSILLFLIIAVYWLIKATYLLYFHPLSGFPGPKLAAVSNAYYGITWLKGRYPWDIDSLLKKYGDVVRIAPNELIFCGTQANYDIHGSAVRNRESFTKTNFQEFVKDAGITAERDPDVHHEIAKQLRPAFSAKALKEQEPILHEIVDDFVNQIGGQGFHTKGVNITEWADWLCFDIAGDMAYGRQFRHVKDGKTSLFLSTFQQIGLWATMQQVFRRFPLLWPFVWIFLPPKVVLRAPTLVRLNRQEIKSRLARKDNLVHPDYMEHFFRQDQEPTEDWLLAQANVLMVAGFDPMTNLLVAIIYYLCCDPQKLMRLRRELRKEFDSYEEINTEKLQKLKYLQAVIEEGLRIHTNAAFGLPRISPGQTVDGHYVPKGTVVQYSNYRATHDERNFALPCDFHPERFLPASHPLFDPRFGNDNKRAFVPFSMGPRGCPGQNSAYMQIRLILGKLLWSYDMEMTNSESIEWQRDMRLYAIYQRPQVFVRFWKAGLN